MSNHHKLLKEQLLHMLFGTLIFIVLGAIAVALDLAARGIVSLGVSSFTHHAIEYTAHALLVVDLVLFLVYILKSSVDLVKEMLQ